MMAGHWCNHKMKTFLIAHTAEATFKECFHNTWEDFTSFSFPAKSPWINCTRMGEMMFQSNFSKSNGRFLTHCSPSHDTEWHWTTYTLNERADSCNMSLLMSTSRFFNYHQGHTLPLSEPPKDSCLSRDNTPTNCMKVYVHPKDVNLRNKYGCLLIKCVCFSRNNIM